MDWLPKAAFDVAMARTFSDPRSPLYWDTIGGCAVTPPCGHVLTHESGTRGHHQGARRRAEDSIHSGKWHQWWCRGGTRPMPSGRGSTPTLMSMPGPEDEPVYMPGAGPTFPDVDCVRPSPSSGKSSRPPGRLQEEGCEFTCGGDSWIPEEYKCA